MTNLCSKCVSPIASRHNLDDLSSLPYLDITSSSIRSAPSLTQADGDSFIPPHCLDLGNKLANEIPSAHVSPSSYLPPFPQTVSFFSLSYLLLRD